MSVTNINPERLQITLGLPVIISAVLFVGSAIVSSVLLLYGIYARLGAIEQAQSNAWLLTDQIVYVSRAETMNPTFKYPDPINVFSQNRTRSPIGSSSTR